MGKSRKVTKSKFIADKLLKRGQIIERLVNGPTPPEEHGGPGKEQLKCIFTHLEEGRSWRLFQEAHSVGSSATLFTSNSNVEKRHDDENTETSTSKSHASLDKRPYSTWVHACRSPQTESGPAAMRRHRTDGIRGEYWVHGAFRGENVRKSHS